MSFIRPKAKSFFDCNSSKGLKFVTKLCLGFSHLREHELKHSFQGSSNPLCSCSLDVESPICYFLHYSPLFTIERNTLQNTISQIHNKLLDINESNFSIFSKILERLIFEQMFPFFIQNIIIATNQSGFKPTDSCINQLI